MSIRSRPSSAAYAAGWERIFGGKPVTVTVEAIQHMVRSYKISKKTAAAIKKGIRQKRLILYPVDPEPTIDQLSKQWESQLAERER